MGKRTSGRQAPAVGVFLVDRFPAVLVADREWADEVEQRVTDAGTDGLGLPDVQGPWEDGTFNVLDGPHGTYPSKSTETLWCADADDARTRARLAHREGRQWEAIAAHLDRLSEEAARVVPPTDDDAETIQDVLDWYGVPDHFEGRNPEFYPEFLARLAAARAARGGQS